MKANGQRMVTPVVFNDSHGDPASMDSYSDDHHGFLRVEIGEGLMVGRYYEVPRPQEPYSKGSHLLDYFEFDFKAKAYRANTLP